MPFYQGTRRVLLSAPNDPFLPQAGPFALGLDGIPVAPRASSLSSLTVSSNSTIPTNRRKTMLKYNRLTINQNRTWSASLSDMCAMVWANQIIVNGTITTNGSDGDSAFGNEGAPGGSGAGGAGGGGGGIQCTCPCFPNNPGGGGGGSNSGEGGAGGGQSFVCCNPYAAGGSGGLGVGKDNWGVGSDGYDYVSLLDLDPENSGQPWGYGGNGSNGDTGGGGGGGGGAAGIQIYVCNSIRAGAFGALTSAGGSAGLNGSSDLFASGGDGGCIAILTKSYDGSLNGKVGVPSGLNGNIDGSARIFKINSDNTFTSKTFAQTW